MPADHDESADARAGEDIAGLLAHVGIVELGTPSGLENGATAPKSVTHLHGFERLELTGDETPIAVVHPDRLVAER